MIGKIAAFKAEKQTTAVHPRRPNVFSTSDHDSTVATFSTTSCIFCNGHHGLSFCTRFRALPIEKRAEIVKIKRCCFRCLNTGHVSRDCRKKTALHCKSLHHRLLHGAPRIYPKKDDSAPVNVSVISSQADPIVPYEEPTSFVGVTRPAKTITLLPIVPIKVIGKKGPLSKFSVSWTKVAKLL